MGEEPSDTEAVKLVGCLVRADEIRRYGASQTVRSALAVLLGIQAERWNFTCNVPLTGPFRSVL